MDRCIKLGFFEVSEEKSILLDQGPRGDERLLRQALWGEGYYEAVIYDPEGTQLELTI